MRTDPITAVLPTADSQTLLITTLDSHVRLLDLSTGQMLNTFKGHIAKEYRIRACFGAAEATVVCGDEEGKIWSWDLVDVSLTLYIILESSLFVEGYVLICRGDIGQHLTTQPTTHCSRESDYLDGISPY